MEFSKPLIMGIVNITPDSFYKDSRFKDTDELLQKIRVMIQDGADIIDIGGYSSRPNAEDISEQEELNRIIPIIDVIHSKFPNTLLSIDTFRSNVAEQAILKGVSIINDISGGKADPSIFKIAAKYECPYIMMHMKGTPQTMQNNCDYSNLIQEMLFYFSNQILSAKKEGIKDIIIDPGFGFSKTIDQNYTILAELEKFNLFKLPILVGVSRKSMIYKHLNIDSSKALNGTSVLNTIALTKGAKILRVHDVKEAKEAALLTEKLFFRH